MKWLRIIIVLGVLPLFAFYTGGQEEWQLQRNRNNISVFSRLAEATGAMEMRAVSNIKSPLSNIVAMLKDVDYYPQWMYRCSEARVLKVISETEFIYYQVTTVPWPIKNRDMIIHVKIAQDQETGEVRVALKGLPDYLERSEELVRVKIFEGQWILKPLPNGQVKIMQDILVVPNGEIPAWMVNLAAVEGPYGTMEGLVNQIQDNRFANQVFSFLKEEI
jgi:hypothetical protein